MSGDEATDDPPSPDEPTSRSEGDLDTVGTSVSYTIYECAVCGTTVLGLHDDEPALSCHGEPLTPVSDPGIDHATPDLATLLIEVFEMPKMTIDVCHYVFEMGTASIEETADHFGYDRSTMSRYLRELADAGFIDRHTLNKESGGEIYVYEAMGLEETRRKELLGFLEWSGTAIQVMDEANEIKAACASSTEEDLDEIFWELYQERRTV